MLPPRLALIILFIADITFSARRETSNARKEVPVLVSRKHAIPIKTLAR